MAETGTTIAPLTLTQEEAAGALNVPIDTLLNLSHLLSSDNTEIRASAARLAGLWKQKKLIPPLKSIVDREGSSDRLRAAAIRSLAELAAEMAVDQFRPFITSKHSSTVYIAALEAVSQRDVNAAAIAALKLLTELDDADSFGPILSTIMHRRSAAEGGPA